MDQLRNLSSSLHIKTPEQEASNGSPNMGTLLLGPGNNVLNHESAQRTSPQYKQRWYATVCETCNLQPRNCKAQE